MDTVVRGFLLGFFFVLGDRTAQYALNLYRDRQMSRQPFLGKPPYELWPHG